VDSDSMVRSKALQALGLIGSRDPNVQEILFAALKSTNSVDQIASVRALGEASLNVGTVGEKLLAWLKDNPRFADHAASSLSSLYFRHGYTTPAIKKLFEEDII